MSNFNREVIKFTSEADWLAARLNDITSTDAAALLGVSPYSTAYKLYNIKTGRADSSIPENSAMRWGKRLQDTIAEGIAHDNGWQVRKMDEYIRIGCLRVGSSFDFAIGDDTLLEIKNVSERSFAKWTDERAPEHIEIQVQHQLFVSDRKLCYIGALVGGNRIHLIRRERNEELIGRILSACADFWATVDSQVAPSPNLEKDSAEVVRLLSHAEPNKTIQSSRELEKLCAEYADYGKRLRDIEAIREKLKAQILMQMGDAEKAYGSKYTISAPVVGPTTVNYERKGYRSFNVKERKEL